MHDEPRPSGGGAARGWKWSRPVRRAARGPFGDVGVRFGGSEHHQCRAPALRIHRATSVAGGPSRHLGGRWTPTTTSVAGGAPGPSGLGRRPIGRRAVRTGSRTSSEVKRARCRRRKPTAAIDVHGGFGHRGRARNQRLRPTVQRRTTCSFGWRWRASPVRASARAGARHERGDFGRRRRVEARPSGRGWSGQGERAEMARRQRPQ
jgi:hypothetical protein